MGRNLTSLSIQLSTHILFMLLVKYNVVDLLLNKSGACRGEVRNCGTKTAESAIGFVFGNDTFQLVACSWIRRLYPHDELYYMYIYI